jgi:hypothetical protein
MSGVLSPSPIIAVFLYDGRTAVFPFDNSVVFHGWITHDLIIELLCLIEGKKILVAFPERKCHPFDLVINVVCHDCIKI